MGRNSPPNTQKSLIQDVGNQELLSLEFFQVNRDLLGSKDVIHQVRTDHISHFAFQA